ncbi:hypothetical protein [Bacillus coreaensis]
MNNNKKLLIPRFTINKGQVVDNDKEPFDITKEGLEKLLKKHHTRYPNFYAENIIDHFIKLEKNLSTLKDNNSLKENYTFLYRVINRNLRYLTDFIHYSIDKMVSRLATKNGHFYFFAKSRDLPLIFNYSNYNTWNRNINIFCTLGLIEKVPFDNINRTMRRRAIREKKQLAKFMNINATKLKEATFYTIPLYDKKTLMKANRLAKTMLENNYRANAFSKIFLINVFGQEFADKVFQDNRSVSEYSNYVSGEIEKFILDEIEKVGYTTKSKIINELEINFKKVNNKEYGFLKGSKTAIIEREFNRSISIIKGKHGLEYRKANRELIEKFSLDGYKNIIFKTNN